MSFGTVYLVGAGPGDPSLLTLRAAELLGSVRMVAHDLLVPQSILKLTRQDAELHPVGRRQGDPKINYRLHPKVLELVSRGHDVLRLKCGDPMIFGRGSEEAQVLAAAGIPYQIVPGVSAALGAASYTGISLTHRDLASDCVFATGHGTPSPDQTRSNWDSLAQSTGTLALYMSLGRAREVMANLVQCGRSPETPAAFVFRASRADQLVISGTLANLADQVDAQSQEGPALLLIGKTVDLHQEIAWTHRCPFLGDRIIVARARSGSSRIAADFRRLGASVVEAPILDSHPCLEPGQLQEFLGQPTDPRAQVLLWGDEQAVRAAQPWIRECVAQGGATSAQWVALDHRSARPLVAMGIKAPTVLAGATPKTLAPHLEGWVGKSVHLMTHTLGRPNLETWLRDAGVAFSWIGLHEMHERWPAAVQQGGDLVVLPSSSAAKALLSCPWAARWMDRPMIVFGDKTAQEARRWGATNLTFVQPGQATDAALRILGKGTHLEELVDDELDWESSASNTLS